MNIYEIIARSQALKDEKKIDSVSPDRVGALIEDTLKYINEYQLLSSSPAIHKTYESVSAMQEDAEPVSDLTGRPLKHGQLVIITPTDQTDPTAGYVYRYDGIQDNSSVWTFVSKIGSIHVDADLNAASVSPVQNRVVTRYITEIIAAVGRNNQFVGVATVGMNPGQPIENIYYIANVPGIYTYFGGIELEQGEVAFLKWNGSWSKITLFKVSGENILISEPYFPVNEHTESELTIAPNIYHKWGEVTSLTIALAPPTDDSVTNEYIIEFTAGATAPSITLPDNLLFAGALELEANATYQLSIINGLVVWSAFKEE